MSEDEIKLWGAHIDVLKERAITPEYAWACGLRSWSGQQQHEQLKQYGIKSPYVGLPLYRHGSGIEIPYPIESRDGIERVRIRLDNTSIEVSEEAGNEGTRSHGVKTVTLPRYVAQAGVPVAIYRPPVVRLMPGGALVEWATVRTDTGVPIYCTEAPLKALALSDRGMPSIGLGGVLAGPHATHQTLDDWGDVDPRSVGSTLRPAPDLASIDWRRRAYITFDANIFFRPLVALGAARIAFLLEGLGADVRIIRVPLWSPHDTGSMTAEEALLNPKGESDQGPDDYIYRYGLEAFRRLVDAAEPANVVALVQHRTQGLAAKSEERRQALSTLLEDLYCRAYCRVRGEAYVTAQVAPVFSPEYRVTGLRAAIKEFAAKISEAVRDDSGVQPFTRGDHVEVSERLLQTELKGAIFDDGRVHTYEETQGIWVMVKPEAVHSTLKKYAGIPIGEKNPAPLKLDHHDLKGIRTATEEELEHRTGEFFRVAPIGFAFRNGFVTIDPTGSIQISPHSPENRAKWRYDFDFDQKLECPVFTKFLLELTRDDAPEDRQAKVRLVLEHAGASLLGQAWRGGTALILHGAGNDGKSTLVSILKSCFPREAVTAVPPHDFGNDYTRAMLAGSLYNVVGELADKELRDAEAIKDVITGRDLLKARHPYERPFFFTCRAGQAIVANALPAVSDQSKGFWRRWAVIPFTRSFRAEEEVRDIEEQVAVERNAIIVTLIEAAAAWVARGYRFELPQSVQDASRGWRDGADAVSTWIASACVLDADQGIAPDSAFTNFDLWREQRRFGAMSIRTFGERCRAVFRGMAREGRLPDGTTPSRRATIERDGAFRHRTDGLRYPILSQTPNADITLEDVN